MDGDKLAEHTPNAKNVSAQIVYPSPKIWDFDEKKASLGVLSPCVRLNKHKITLKKEK